MQVFGLSFINQEADESSNLECDQQGCFLTTGMDGGINEECQGV
jgi:hypothetical protein